MGFGLYPIKKTVSTTPEGVKLKNKKRMVKKTMLKIYLLETNAYDAVIAADAEGRAIDITEPGEYPTPTGEPTPEYIKAMDCSNIENCENIFDAISGIGIGVEFEIFSLADIEKEDENKLTFIKEVV